jgi:hypothetical protein
MTCSCGMALRASDGPVWVIDAHRGLFVHWCSGTRCRRREEARQTDNGQHGAPHAGNSLTRPSEEVTGEYWLLTSRIY